MWKYNWNYYILRSGKQKKKNQSDRFQNSYKTKKDYWLKGKVINMNKKREMITQKVRLYQNKEYKN